MYEKRAKKTVTIKLDHDLYDVVQVLRNELDKTQIWVIENALRQTYLEAVPKPVIKRELLQAAD